MLKNIGLTEDGLVLLRVKLTECFVFCNFRAEINGITVCKEEFRAWQVKNTATGKGMTYKVRGSIYLALSTIKRQLLKNLRIFNPHITVF